MSAIEAVLEEHNVKLPSFGKTEVYHIISVAIQLKNIQCMNNHIYYILLYL